VGRTQITGLRFGISGTEVLLDPAVETASGLTKIGVANCMKLLTVDPTQMVRTAGYLSDVVLRQIESCRKQVLELS
jgi:hypothetical protein